MSDVTHWRCSRCGSSVASSAGKPSAYTGPDCKGTAAHSFEPVVLRSEIAPTYPGSCGWGAPHSGECMNHSSTLTTGGAEALGHVPPISPTTLRRAANDLIDAISTPAGRDFDHAWEHACLIFGRFGAKPTLLDEGPRRPTATHTAPEQCPECEGTGTIEACDPFPAMRCDACEPPSEDVLRIVHAFDDQERKDAVRELAARVKATETALATLRQGRERATPAPRSDGSEEP